MTDQELKERLSESRNPLQIALISAYAMHDISIMADTQASLIKNAVHDLAVLAKRRKEKHEQTKPEM